MHILATDILICPRCGPGFGLVLLADRIQSRRVMEGRLGCANCREEYPVVRGFGDLRYPLGDPLPDQALAVAEQEDAIRTAAMLGVGQGPDWFLLVGSLAGAAPPISDLVPDLELLGADAGLWAWPEVPGVSRLAAAGRLPFATASIRGIAWNEKTVAPLEEAVRVLAPGGRLVATGGADLRTRLELLGFRALLDENGTVVASPVQPG